MEFSERRSEEVVSFDAQCMKSLNAKINIRHFQSL